MNKEVTKGKNTLETHGEDWYNCQCPICGIKFHLKPSRVKIAKNHYCSKECFGKAKIEYMKGEGNHQYGLKGNKNATWKSDRRLSRYGYIQVRVLDHPFRDKADFVFEHRLIAERYLLNDENSVTINGKRYLNPDYVVHHINFDRTDNRVENLLVMGKQEHMRLHCKLNPAERNELHQFASRGKTLCSTVDGIEAVKCKRVTETAIVPERKTNGAAGFDLYVDTAEDVVIPAGEMRLLFCGVAFDIPKGYYGLIYARSGIASMYGVRPSTCVSVIDSDFRGNVGLPLTNDSKQDYTVKAHERVAQIIFMKLEPITVEEVEELSETERGENGFGSTGR